MSKKQPKPGNPFHLKDTDFFNGEDFFLRVPDCIKRDRGLNALDKLLWSQLAWFDWQYGKVYPRLETLATELGCSEKGIRKSLERLRQQGYITWKTPTLVQKRKKQSNEYQLIWQAGFESRVKTTPESQVQSTGEPIQSPEQSTDESQVQSTDESQVQSTDHYDSYSYYEEKETTTHTQDENGVCDFNSLSPDEEKKDSVAGGNGEVTAEQWKVIHDAIAQEWVKNPSAYKAKLIQKAKDGTLEMPDNGNGSGNKGSWQQQAQQAREDVREFIVNCSENESHPVPVQILVEQAVLQEIPVLPHSLKDTWEALAELYPEHYKVAREKKMLAAKMRFKWKDHEDRRVAYYDLADLDQKMADRIKDELGLVIDVW